MHWDTTSPTWSPSCTTRSKHQQRPGTPCTSSTGCRQPPSPASSARQQHNCFQVLHTPTGTLNPTGTRQDGQRSRRRGASYFTRWPGPQGQGADPGSTAHRPAPPRVGARHTTGPHGDRRRGLPAALPAPQQSPARPGAACRGAGKDARGTGLAAAGAVAPRGVRRCGAGLSCSFPADTAAIDV